MSCGATRKRSVGYSDLTSMLTFLTTGCGIASFHGPMLDRRLGAGAAGYDEDSFMRALTTGEPLGELSAASIETFNPGEASGVLVGGTMRQLVASLGTPFAFAPPKGHVLFLEDVTERPYSLDRMVTQLRLAGFWI
jgi:muramoyltetrapeptide carboxypeptidase